MRKIHPKRPHILGRLMRAIRTVISSHFTVHPGPKPGGFGTLIAKKASFTVSRDGFSSHEGEPGDPKNGPNLRTRRDSVSADRETGLFGPKGTKMPSFGGRATWEMARNSSQIAVKGLKI